ncbi:protoheme IX farnesyltransferase [Mucilaginibacter rubeus]|jgi:protoheme IX farnesyltransferase|uniref:Protoheme IX farnesyltransferase n=1 Tax=Mucilaginibacter rubeus TaxID=2027860 RepID=A0AAE6MLD8_9SPHI|nr:MULTISPECIES: heme o synthase [Mucilaginibacter]QEM07758.1 protoheme IX farnesyltransferase [Mucilaginibacter rubeus]QEM20210.1 protoheme IX farnesyltransferase [Mucilaginibacter gossypii]QTE43073.1 heme o synthase [Mucilaginibacter rubeus]QTE49674.1 heme o synthase [Mucilaginibacter rubeus]QTE54769.1 heme o synthase [Mucilaginibacter rubeus]
MKWADFSKLIKTRLTTLVVFSASISFLIGCRANGHIVWIDWVKLIIGGFLVTSAANAFNEIIEKDLDRLMKRTMDRPIPSGKMTTGQALVLGLGMGMAGTYLLGSLNLLTGLLSVFSILLYAFAYTPLKRKSGIAAVFVGAIPGALPPLIGYVAAQVHGRIDEIALILFSIQFIWQFVHFWAIAWVLDDDYKLAGFRLLPSGKRDLTSAVITFIFAIVLVPVSLLPTFYGYGGYWVGGVSLICSLIFLYQSFMLLRTRQIPEARKLMFGSFFYLPVVQIMFLVDFIVK